MPITIFDSDTIPRDRRSEIEAAVVAGGRHLTKRFEGWIVATDQCREKLIPLWRATRRANVPAISGSVDISAQFHRW
jgi:hypothetical protein